MTLMKRNDANVTLMNRNDSSGLIKISHSSSAQDQPEGLDTWLSSDASRAEGEGETKDKVREKEQRDAKKANECSLIKSQDPSTRFSTSKLPPLLNSLN